MFEDIEDLWSSAKPTITRNVKCELKQFLTDEIDDQISKCTIRQAAEILSQNKEELVELLTKCYEDARENNLVDYVWNFIKPDSKFSVVKYLVAKVAEAVDHNSANIINIKLDPEEKAKVQKIMSRKRYADDMPEEEKNRRPPKCYIPCDPRPIKPAYEPPKSMFEVTEKTNDTQSSSSTVTAETGTSPIVNSSSSSSIQSPNSVSPVAQSSTKKVLYSTSSNRNDSSSKRSSTPKPTSPSPEQTLLSLIKASATKKSVGFPSAAATETNSNKATGAANRQKLKSPLPVQPPSALEEEVDEESEEEIHISRPRDFSYYNKYLTNRQSKPSTPSQNKNNNQHSRDNHQSEERVPSNATVSPTNYGNVTNSRPSERMLPSNATVSPTQRDRVTTTRSNVDDEIPIIPPRNLDRYYKRPSTLSSSSAQRVSPQKSVTTTPKPAPQPAPLRNMFDAVSDDEEEDNNSSDTERPNIVSFDEASINPSNKKSAHCGITSATLVQPHRTVDFDSKVNMSGPNPTENLIAFPNQKGTCYKPEYQLLENWRPITEYEDQINEAFSAFRNVYGVPINPKEELPKPPEHLFIFDSMLSGIPIEDTYKKVEIIDCAHPNSPFMITNFLETEIEEKRTNYIIKNVFICVGLDLLTLDPDINRARTNASYFFGKLLKLLIQAFDPKTSPKRYKRGSDATEIDVLPPKMIFITIPQVKEATVITLNDEIIKMNKRIRQFVAENKEIAARKRVIMEIYDWEKSSAEYDQCNAEHLGIRNDILMTNISKKYAISMIRPDERAVGKPGEKPVEEFDEETDERPE